VGAILAGCATGLRKPPLLVETDLDGDGRVDRIETIEKGRDSGNDALRFCSQEQPQGACLVQMQRRSARSAKPFNQDYHRAWNLYS